MGFPELGSVSLSAIAALRGKIGLPIERDVFFTPEKPLSAYAEKDGKTRQTLWRPYRS